MGSTFTGSDAKQVGTTSPYSSEQISLLNQLISQATGQSGQLDITQSPSYQQAQSTLSQFIQPDQEALQSQFQSQFVDPSLQTFTQQVIPSIQQSFANQGAGRSSALNQTLAQSAENLQTTLAGQLQDLIQQTQQQQLSAAGQLGQLSQYPVQSTLSLLGLGLTPSQETIIQPGSQGILGNLISAGGKIASTAIPK